MSIFATAISCMDGRIQIKLQEYIKNKYDVLYVDTITLAGPVKVIARNQQKDLIHNLQLRSDISINIHQSNIIAVVGHHDCAGVTEDNKTQIEYIKSSVSAVKKWYKDVTVIGLWFDEEFNIKEIND